MENDEDVLHAGIVSKSQKIPEFRPILAFATDTVAFPLPWKSRNLASHCAERSLF